MFSLAHWVTYSTHWEVTGFISVFALFRQFSHICTIFYASHKDSFYIRTFMHMVHIHFSFCNHVLIFAGVWHNFSQRSKATEACPPRLFQGAFGLACKLHPFLFPDGVLAAERPLESMSEGVVMLQTATHLTSVGTARRDKMCCLYAEGKQP